MPHDQAEVIGKKGSIWLVRKIIFNFFSAKNEKPFRVSKNGNAEDMIQKKEFASHQCAKLHNRYIKEK